MYTVKHLTHWLLTGNTGWKFNLKGRETRSAYFSVANGYGGYIQIMHGRASWNITVFHPLLKRLLSVCCCQFLSLSLLFISLQFLFLGHFFGSQMLLYFSNSTVQPESGEGSHRGRLMMCVDAASIFICVVSMYFDSFSSRHDDSANSSWP